MQKLYYKYKRNWKMSSRLIHIHTGAKRVQNRQTAKHKRYSQTRSKTCVLAKARQKLRQPTLNFQLVSNTCATIHLMKCKTYKCSRWHYFYGRFIVMNINERVCKIFAHYTEYTVQLISSTLCSSLSLALSRSIVLPGCLHLVRSVAFIVVAACKIENLICIMRVQAT